MFNQIIAGKSFPRHLSSDHDPLFYFHRWLANLRILEVEEIKSIPYVPEIIVPLRHRIRRDHRS
jgi:putative transposase